MFNQNIKPLLFDINPVKAVEAYKDGCIPTDKEGIVSQSDLLFCATGSKSLNGEDFLKIKPGCYVASVTSSDDEFDFDDLKKWFSAKAIDKFTTKLENANTYFYLINDGNAVNFLSGDRVGNFIRLVQAEILAALSALSKGSFSKNGIHELSQDDRKTIAGFFLNKYLNLE